MYYNGVGVKKSVTEAIELHKKSAKQGYEKAREFLTINNLIYSLIEKNEKQLSVSFKNKQKLYKTIVTLTFLLSSMQLPRLGRQITNTKS